jgi:7-cyano-7-deazaguanine tRNA-ribosyltransferase
MEFFVGWSHSDAKYCDYFENTSMLISAVPENIRPLQKFDKQPKKLMIDSGAVYYVNQIKKTTAQKVFEKQLSFLEDATSDIESISLVQLDEPLMGKITLQDRYAAIERTLFLAWEFMNLYTKSNLPLHIKPMAVIQGFDKASIQYCIHELKLMGYKQFGIGSLLLKNAKEQLPLIKSAAQLVGSSNLHVFGVTGMTQIKEMTKLKISSFDSTRPTKAAAYYSVFYSKPFRTYILASSRVSKSGPRITEPLFCTCPICLNNPNDILIPSPRKYMLLRSIHNYYHLKETINDVLLEQGGEK